MKKDPVVFGGEAHYLVRCRKCSSCVKSRRKLWMGRAIGEVLHAHARGGRTWFVTLTFRSEPQSEKEAIGELQKWFKRIRKGRAEPITRGGVARAIPPAEFRYVAVTERGEKNGRIHLHCLVHGNVRWLQLHSAWGLGHMQARVVKVTPDDNGRIDRGDARVILYATKYIGKSGNKLVASLHYGRPPGARTPAVNTSRSASEPAPKGPKGNPAESPATSPGEAGEITSGGPAWCFTSPTKEDEECLTF